MKLEAPTLLDEVTANGSGTAAQGLQSCLNFNFWIVAASVTTGATVTIEASPDGSNWSTLHTEAITADGVTGPIYAPGRLDQVRANVTARTDGTYTVKMTAN